MVSRLTNRADTIRLGADDDNVNALRGNDRVFGDGGDDTLRGDGGRDELRGGDGRDRLFGGADEDRLFGGDRADVINGGAGADRLSGGRGGDLFDYDQIGEVRGDTILDFNPAGGDRLDFSDIDAIAGGGDDAFDIFLNPTPTPTPAGAGQVGFFDVGGDTVVVASDGEAQARLLVEDADAVDVLNSFIA